MVGRRILRELNGVDLTSTLKYGLRDSMHPVHDRPIGREDNREPEIRVAYQQHMLKHGAPGWPLVVSVPVLVKFPNPTDWHPLAWQPAGELDEVIDIPGEDSLLGCPEVVLLPHLRVSFVLAFGCPS
jgi:hypothetical protein